MVVYVTGDVGGPTLVTTQRLASKKLADRGWIVHPRVNRVCMFDGGVLHGVIPGRGVPPPQQPPPPPPEVGPGEQTSEGGVGGGGSGGPGDANDAGSSPAGGNNKPSVGETAAEEGNPRGGAATGAGKGRRRGGSPQRVRSGMRVTWMVAFWRDIEARAPPAPSASAKPGSAASPAKTLPSGAGAAQPFPEIPPLDSTKKRSARGGGGGGDGTGGPTWPTLFRKKGEGWGAGGGVVEGDVDSATPVVPLPIPQVWEDVDAAENRRAGVGVRRLKRLPAYDLCFQGF